MNYLTIKITSKYLTVKITFHLSLSLPLSLPLPPVKLLIEQVRSTQQLIDTTLKFRNKFVSEKIIYQQLAFFSSSVLIFIILLSLQVCKVIAAILLQYAGYFIAAKL